MASETTVAASYRDRRKTYRAAIRKVATLDTKRVHRENNMRWWLYAGVSALAGAAGFMNAVPTARSEVVDMGKYPDIAGGWGRSEMYQWARGEKPPLTPEYQAVLEANRADRATGGHGTDVMYRCLPPGMPRQMHAYAPMEIVITPKTTYVLIDHIHDDRRIYTDGRTWPEEELEPLFSGHSIGKWVDEDGDGKYDVLEVETRHIKGPRTLDGLLPTHTDNKTVVKERIYLDRANPDILHDEITLIDDAYTRPWTITKSYPRYKKGETIWWSEEVCAENNAHVSVGKEDYYVSSDGYLMPVRKSQPPPDLRCFKRPGN
jgi:hypothetical protein